MMRKKTKEIIRRLRGAKAFGFLRRDQKIRFKILGRVLILLVFLFSLQACQCARELHFIKAGDNYYRIKIRERSFASKARYLSGFFDENAVDKYFGEMSQPKEGARVSSEKVSLVSGNGSSDISDKKLVLVLSTNSDAIAEQIGAFAENEQMLESIARMVNKSKIDESNQYSDQIAKSKSRNKTVIDLGDRYILALDDAADSLQARENITMFLRFLKDKSDRNATSTELLIQQFENQKK